MTRRTRGLACFLFALAAFSARCSRKSSECIPSEPCGAASVTVGIKGSILDARTKRGLPAITARFKNVCDATSIRITSDGNGDLVRTELTSSRICEQYEVTTFSQGPSAGTYTMIDRVVPYLLTTDTNRKTLAFEILLEPSASGPI